MRKATTHAQTRLPHRALFLRPFHISQILHPTLGFSFIIDRGGHVYEGRGWETQAQHVNEEVDSESIAVAFIGKFYDTDSDPEEEMLDAFRSLMYYGIRHGYLKKGLVTIAHAELDENTPCPGLGILDIWKDESYLVPSKSWGKATYFGRLYDRVIGVRI